MTREKKKRSKEAKQARLNSLAGLGIPIPPTHVVSGVPSPLYSSFGNSNSMGVIRDTRMMRQERPRPYMTIPIHSRIPSDQREQIIQQQQQPQQSSTGYQPPIASRRIQSDSMGRRRGVTMDSFYVPTGATPSVLQSEDSLSTTRGPMNVTSLSQPSTPEATYSMHASMLSQELSRNQSTSPAQTFNRPYMGHQSMALKPSIPPNNDSDTSFRSAAFVSGFDYITSPSHQSEGPSTSSRSSAGDITATASTSVSSIVPTAPLTSPSTIQRLAAPYIEMDQQMAVRRRSSFDVGNFWRRTSVADAAVANFFDRVIQARGSRKGSFEGLNTPGNRQYPPSVQANSHLSSILPTTSSIPSSSEVPYSIYTSLQEVMQNATPLDAPYTALNSNPDPLTFSHPFALGSETLPNRDQSTEEHHSTYSSPSVGAPFDSSQFDVSGSDVGDQGGYSTRGFYNNLPTSAALTTSPEHNLGQGPNIPSTQLHLGTLPNFQSHRQPTINTADSGGSSSGLQAEQYYYSPQYVGDGGSSAPSSSYAPNGSSDQNMYFAPHHQQQPPPLPHQHLGAGGVPALPTPMTELSSNMFAMAPPSNTSPASPTTLSGAYNSRAFLSPWNTTSSYEELHLHQNMTTIGSRQGSLSANSIQEEEEESEGAQRTRS